METKVVKSFFRSGGPNTFDNRVYIYLLYDADQDLRQLDVQHVFMHMH